MPRRPGAGDRMSPGRHGPRPRANGSPRPPRSAKRPDAGNSAIRSCRAMIRCVPDTNVITSALPFGSSSPDRAFAQAPEQGRIPISDALRNEPSDMLGREEFDRYVTRENPSSPRKPIIPAKAGIHCNQESLDSRFRGNDGLNKTMHLKFVHDRNPFRSGQTPAPSEFRDVADPGRNPLTGAGGCIPPSRCLATA